MRVWRIAMYCVILRYKDLLDFCHLSRIYKEDFSGGNVHPALSSITVGRSLSALPAISISKALFAVCTITRVLFGVVLVSPMAEFQFSTISGHLSMLQVGLVGIAAFVTWYVVSALFTWWRLRQIPGPFVAKFSYLWLGRTTHSGKQYYVHRELHKKYGPLVRIGPNYIITDEPDIIKNISSARSAFHRDGWYLTGRFNPYRDNLFTKLEPSVHSKAKLRLSGSYNGRETNNLEPNVDEQVQNLVGLLRRKYAVSPQSSSRPLLDLGPTSNYFTLDVITKVAFGHEFGYLREETDLYNFMQHVRDLWPRMSTSADVPWIRRILFSKPFLLIFGPKTTDKDGFGALMRVAEQYVSQRFKQDAKDLDDSLVGPP